MGISSADILRNPDFESPPTNTTTNISTPFLLLTEANSIPGWSFSGTVWYVTLGTNISLPTENGHAVQLGPRGIINQTFVAVQDNYMGQVLTFTIAAVSANCLRNLTAVNISSPGKSQVFYLKGNYGKETWQTYAYHLGFGNVGNDSVDLMIQNVAVDADHNNTCWPIVDALLLRQVEVPKYYEDNMLANGGFEIGSALYKNSSQGILLNEENEDEESRHMLSPLQEWSITGTIKYIDSKHYAVPRGEAAIELLSNSGIKINDYLLPKGSTYALDFMIGDANDSCVEDFLVYVQVGELLWNFTMHSNGLGSSQRHSITFKVDIPQATTSFSTFNEIISTDNLVCGPVIDSVKLKLISLSSRLGAKLQMGVISSCFVFTILIGL